jgi:hypothetical protein
MPKSASSARPGAAGSGTRAPGSGGNPFDREATIAERMLARRINQMIRDPRLAQARASAAQGKVEARVRRLELDKRQLIHTPEGRVRTLNQPGRDKLARINRSLDRADQQLRRIRQAVSNIQRRQRRGS